MSERIIDADSERDGATVPIAIVGLGAILPDAPDVATFWQNLEQARYSITDVQAASKAIGSVLRK